MTSLDRGNDVSDEEAAIPGEVRRWRAFSLLAVAYFMTVVDLTITNVALPTIGRKLHFPQSDLQWVGSIRSFQGRHRRTEAFLAGRPVRPVLVLTWARAMRS